MNRENLFSPLAALLLVTSLATPAGAQPAPATGPFQVSGNLQNVAFEQVVTGLGFPTSIVNAGDARLFITERPGRILILEGGRTLSQPFLDIRSLVGTEGEGGLLSAAFHPRYSENGFFFLNYTNRAGDTVIARYQVSAGDPNRADAQSGRTLMVIDQPFSNHNGGQIQFGPDGYLYIGMGDGGAAFDPACRAQRDDTLLGKMLRIDVDQSVNAAPFYGIPADNPFRGGGAPADEVWASGLRNPWRFSFDRETGDLWIADVGQGQREEIDFQPAASDGGENYGWKVMEGTVCGSREACSGAVPACDSPAFTLPVLEYDHGDGCSVTGGYVYRGGRIPQLRGTYFFADFCQGTIWGAARQGTGFVVRRVPQAGGQIVTFGEDLQGELFLGTSNGRIFRLEGEGQPVQADRVGLYDSRQGTFYLMNTSGNGASERKVRFGPRNSKWTPLSGDWDGDGKATVGFYDPAARTFRLKNSLAGGTADIVLKVDPPSANVVPIAGDWDGDGRDTVGFYNNATGAFTLLSSLTGQGTVSTVTPGLPTGRKIPIVGDWNGDGRDTVGVYDVRDAVFHLVNSLANGQPPSATFQFGSAIRGWLPVAGDWDGDGGDTVGVYDPLSGTFRLINRLAAGQPDITFRYGPRRSSRKPLAGNW